MLVYRAYPTYVQIGPSNLRSRNNNNNINNNNAFVNNHNNLVNANNNANVNNNAVPQTPAVHIVDFALRATPKIFSGDASSNGQIWWDKFLSFCDRNNIPEDLRVHEFRLLISDACENWFVMLPLNTRHTYDRLRHSFEQQYCNPNANIAESQLLY